MKIAPRSGRTLALLCLVTLLLGCSGQAPPAALPPPVPHAPAPAGARAAQEKLAAAPVETPGSSWAALPVAAAVQPVAYAINNPYAVPGVFRKGQFHLHTASSFDGDKSFPPDVTARVFKDAGYGFIVFTDHDVASRYTGLNDDTFYAGTGFESTSISGHIGALFTGTPINPALPPQARIAAIRQAGGIAVANHPDWEIGYSGDNLLQLQGYQLLEIYNHISTGGHPERLAQNLEKWRQVVNARGSQDPVWGIAVSDTHKGFTGGGWTVVKCAQVGEAALKAALTRGSLYASNGPDFDAIDVAGGEIVVRASAGADSAVLPPTAPIQIRFIDQDGRLVQAADGPFARFRPTGREQWVRIEAGDAAGHTAWSQPLWITPAGS